MELSVFLCQIAIFLAFVTGGLMYWDLSNRQAQIPQSRPSLAPVLTRVQQRGTRPVIISGHVVSSRLIKVNGQRILLPDPIPQRLAGRRVSLVLEPPLS